MARRDPRILVGPANAYGAPRRTLVRVLVGSGAILGSPIPVARRCGRLVAELNTLGRGGAPERFPWAVRASSEGPLNAFFIAGIQPEGMARWGPRIPVGARRHPWGSAPHAGPRFGRVEGHPGLPNPCRPGMWTFCGRAEYVRARGRARKFIRGRSAVSCGPLNAAFRGGIRGVARWGPRVPAGTRRRPRGAAPHAGARPVWRPSVLHPRCSGHCSC